MACVVPVTDTANPGLAMIFNSSLVQLAQQLAASAVLTAFQYQNCPLTKLPASLPFKAWQSSEKKLQIASQPISQPMGPSGRLTACQQQQRHEWCAAAAAVTGDCCFLEIGLRWQPAAATARCC